ncbi:MAG: pyridoxamine 5'-phosphate oxidase family protein [Anaerolineaceae bacterium]|jgi:hypothetical protein
MATEKKIYQAFSPDEIKAFEPAMKVGILATVNEQGLPHVTMISTMMAANEKELCWGQFMEGQSKENIRRNPKAGWMIMTLNRDVWRGKATFTHTATSGKDFDFYNNTPLFRYNAYFGVHTVYYMDLVEHSGKAPLPMNAVVFGSILTIIGRMLSGSRSQKEVLNGWTRAFLNQLTCLKFLSYIDADGYPAIIPAIQAQAADAEHVLFSTAVYGNELSAIPAGTTVALLGLALTMEDVLLRGTFEGFHRFGGVRCGSMKIDWVYNSMPPVFGQIYPPLPLETVKEF